MAWMKKYIDKYTFMFISGIWNALAVFIPLHFQWSPESIVLILTIGNLVIQWLSMETQDEHDKEAKAS